MSPLRRRSAPSTDVGAARRRAALAALADQGWTLPTGLVSDRPPVTTRLGVADSPWTATVDERGAVAPTSDWFTLDWAVGAEDRWHVPAREANVTQVRLDHAPVVETRMRVPGGEVLHRAYVGRGPRFPHDDEWLVVEVENASSVPIALAWLVRPWTVAGVTAVPEIRLAPGRRDDTAGAGPWHLTVNEIAAVLPRRPSRWAAGTGDLGGADPLAAVVEGRASADWTGTDAVTSSDATPARSDGPRWFAGRLTVESEAGLASLAMVVPVPHTAVARIVLPRGVWPPGDEEEIGWPVEMPDAGRIAAGWTRHAERGPRIELPDPVLADAVAAARRSLSLSHRVERQDAASDQAVPPSAHWIATRGDGRGDGVGERMEVLAALTWWGEHASVDRLLARWPEDQQRGGGFGSPEATAAALRALAVHAIASDDVGPARAWLPEVGGAIESLGKALRKPPPGTVLAAVAEGLDAGAVLLARLDQSEAAARVAADAERARDRSSVPDPPSAPEHSSLGRGGPPPVPRRLAADAVAAARDGVRSEALWALLRQASATWTWSDPERWVGDDGLVMARLLDAVARLLVADQPAGPAVLPWLPPSWWGRGWEVHGAPTRWGTLSYAVRWHGDRPAVLWELAGEPEGEPVITAPGLDPAWSSRDRRGEALLAPIAPPPEAAMADDPGASSGVAVAAPPRSVWRPQDPGPDAPPSAGVDPVPAERGPDEPGPASLDVPPDPGTSFT